MAKNYKGFTIKAGEVFENDVFVRVTFGKYTMPDGERLNFWQLSDKIAELNAPKKEMAQPSKSGTKKVAQPENGTTLAQLEVPSVPKVAQPSQDNGTPKHMNFVGFYIINGTRYDSIRKAATAAGESPNTIKRWCKAGKNGCSFEPK